MPSGKDDEDFKTEILGRRKRPKRVAEIKSSFEMPSVSTADTSHSESEKGANFAVVEGRNPFIYGTLARSDVCISRKEGRGLGNSDCRSISLFDTECAPFGTSAFETHRPIQCVQCTVSILANAVHNRWAEYQHKSQK